MLHNNRLIKWPSEEGRAFFLFLHVFSSLVLPRKELVGEGVGEGQLVLVEDVAELVTLLLLALDTLGLQRPRTQRKQTCGRTYLANTGPKTCCSFMLLFLMVCV